MSNFSVKQFFRYFLVMGMVLTSVNALAEQKRFLTVNELIDNGFTQLVSAQLTELLKENTVEVRDIETKAIYLSARDKNAGLNKRKVEQEKVQDAKYLLSADLLARAPMLSDNAKYEVKGDELISRDGIRTYHIKFYEKQGRIFGARDIDNGNVFYEIEVR